MRFLLLSAVVIVLIILNLFIGSVEIHPQKIFDILIGKGSDDIEKFIILGSRLPMAVTAAFAGAGLAVSGLLLQTAFRNPLAGPSVLGINSGASLGVAVVMLFLGGTIGTQSISIGGNTAIIFGALAGSILVMTLLIFLSTLLKNDLMLLIAGIMTGYLVSSVIMLLNYVSSAEGIQSYVMWGMSSFNGVSMGQLPLFCILTLSGIILATLLIKPLDLLLLGDSYARNLGVNLGRVRNTMLVSTGILTAVITAYCGPVSFIGLAVPHIARMLFKTDSHKILMPAVMLCGSAVTLGCTLICVLPSQSVLPVNAVTPLIGVPVVIYVILCRRGK